MTDEKQREDGNTVRPIQPMIEALQALGGLVPTLGIEAEFVDDEIVCSMPILQQHTGAPNTAHGGCITSLLDTALGFHAMQYAVSQERVTSTVELKVNFLRPAKLGMTLVTKTQIQSKGRSLLVLSGSAFDKESGEQVAFAVGTFNLYRPEGR